MIEQNNVRKIYEDLDQELGQGNAAGGSRWHLIVCGGAALISLGIRSTSTVDIDVLEPDLDQAVKRAATVVGAKYGLMPDWINNGPKSLTVHFPGDWRQRLSEIFRSKYLTISSIGRPELILSKVFAEAEPGCNIRC